MKAYSDDWQYRVTVKTQDGRRICAIREVFFDENGKPNAWGLDPAWPQGNSRAEVAYDYDQMKKAFNWPMIDLDEEVQMSDVG